MFVDIVIPQGNEKAFLAMASHLGIDGLIFLYSQQEYRKHETKMESIDFAEKPFSAPGLIFREKECAKMKRDPLRFSVAFSPEEPVSLFEKGDADAVFGLELMRKKDSLHHRTSGLNQVLCASATERELIIGVALHPLLNVSGMVRSKLLGRIAQNIRFSRKYSCEMAVSSFAASPYEMRSPKELSSLLVSLGATPEQAHSALESAAERLSRVHGAWNGVLKSKDISCERSRKSS